MNIVKSLQLPFYMLFNIISILQFGCQNFSDDPVGSDTDTNRDTDTDLDVDSDTDTGTDTGIDTETDTGTDTGTDTETDTGTGTDTETETETETEIDTDTEKHWEDSQKLETIPTSSYLADGTDVSVNASGTAVVVWSMGPPNTADIMSNYYTVKDGWSTYTTVDNLTNDAVNPQVSIDPNGNGIAVWQQSDGVRTNILANRYVDGKGWGTAALIETDNAGAATTPQVGVDSSGNAIAVWQQSNGTITSIWANQYAVGVGWGTAALIETDDKADMLNPRLAVDPTGNAIAVWHRTISINQKTIWANRYEAGVGWGSAVRIDNDDVLSAVVPEVSVATDASGNAIAVWQKSNGTRKNIWYNRYTVDDVWGTPGYVDTSNSYDTSDPEIAMDSSGNATVAWCQSDGTRNNIWARRYAAGAAWDTATLIEDVDTPASDPKVGRDELGNSFVVWTQTAVFRDITNIVANRYESGIGWGSDEIIDAVSYSAFTPDLAVDPDGNAIVVWIENEEDYRYNVWVIHYK